MYFSKKEQPIIEGFYNKLSKISVNELVTLVWESGTIQAAFDTCFDDFDENNQNDEYISFAFKALKVDDNPPVEITENKYFIINYHNFPNAIYLNNEKLN